MLIKKIWVRSLILGLLCTLFMTGSAFAAVSSMVVRDNAKQDYLFDYQELIESYTKHVIGLPAPLYNDFSKKSVVAISTKNKGPVDYADVLTAYTLSVIEGKKFDVVTYIESSNSVMFEIQPGTKSVVVRDGQIVLVDLGVPGLPNALKRINALTSPSDMSKALVDHARELKLNLGDFNTLNTYAKNVVAADVLSKRPNSGYGSTEALKSVFDSGVNRAAAQLSTVLKAINDASSSTAMNQALTDNAVFLMLNMDRFNQMHVFAKDLLVREMLTGRTYGSVQSVNIAFFNALDKTEAMIKVQYTHYNYTISQMVDVQMTRNPQTDLLDGRWRTADRNLVSWHVNPLNFNETNIPAVRPISNVHMREGPADGFPVITTLLAGSGPFFVLNEARVENDKTWYRVMNNVRTGWVHGDFVIEVDRKGEGIFQFLLLSETAGIPAVEINRHILAGKGSLEGMAEAFIEGARLHNINEVFLISLALHETGQGTSVLARGMEWDGPDGLKTVYNMFGIRAVDSDPINRGAEHAYSQGWFTPEAAIIGGAQFTAQNYIHHATYKQDTLYKMRWNPARPGSHQYATDIGWAAKQVRRIKELYDLCNTYVLRFDIPVYVK